MNANPLIELNALGQSIWFDNIERKLITQGELKRMIEEDAISGITSNPAIFEKAISNSDEYADQLRELVEQNKTAMEIYESLATTDIRMAADTLAPVYEKTEGVDGFVSLECSPLLARDTRATIEEVRRLWQWLDRPNVMIKIPGTEEGMPAIEQCIYEGININITLLFSLASYDATIEAYLRGLERRASEGKPVTGIASVASFFVSRIDTAIDKRLEQMINESKDEEERARLGSLMGRIAIANARMAYQRFKEVFHGPRFRALADKGARVQRPLWASTSTKNPAYKDIYYVEALIAPQTIDTLPPQTLAAFRDHGKVRISIEDNLDEDRALLRLLEEVGISLDEVTAQVLNDGVRLFAEPFEKLLRTIDAKRAEILARQATTGTARD
ncbi:MAG TPA: transaldolase [Blastocatellia bacterium]